MSTRWLTLLGALVASALPAAAASAPTTPFSAWRSAHFTPAQIAAGLAADAASPAGDGVPNLVRYALGLTPWENAGAAVSGGETSDGFGLRYPLVADASDVVCTVEASSDMRTWTAVGGATPLPVKTPLDADRVECVLADRSAAGAARRFLRLRVQRVEAPELVRLPIEILGEPGTTEPAAITVSGNPADASYLWLQTHRLSWREDGEFARLDNPRNTVRPGSKGSVRLNGGPWVGLTNQTVTSEQHEAEFGGLNGSYMTVRVRLPLAALGSPGLRAGGNLLEFRFDATDGISSGWRVLALDVRTAAGASILAPNFVRDNPDGWLPPRHTPADIAAGKVLWETAPLTDLGFSNTQHPIRGKCASCHFRDGQDLAYFNYSNKSIIARSRFHGLNQTQAEQVASYIRSLDLKLPAGYTRQDAGRPWNPPYQPGPGLDARPVELWAAGAGLDAVLERDADMQEYLFPGGEIDPGITGATGFLNPRETPQAFQYPDWNAWLPTFALEDLVADPSVLATSEPVVNLRTAEDWLTAYRWNQMETDGWFMRMGRWYVQVFDESRVRGSGFPGEYWYTDRTQPGRTLELSLAQARHNLARSAWFNLRLFELLQNYKLTGLTERSGASGTPVVPTGYRSWAVMARTVFETAPHFMSDHAGLDFNFTQPGNYLSTAWYSLEQVFNGGYHAAAFSIDWNYHPFHIMGTHRGGTGFYNDGPIHAYRAAWSLLWMYQSIPTIDLSKNPPQPWTPQTFGFFQRQFGLGLDLAFGAAELEARGDITRTDRARLQEALAQAFLGIAERYTPDQWLRRAVDDDAHRTSENFETMAYAPRYNPNHAYDLPERGYQADAYYLRIKQLKESGLLEPATVTRLVNWGKGVWPLGEWNLLEP
ncbi:MAG: hypothetical protein IPL39_16540 [Opitutaceae bacterium]|nr:hypothetical protein [Opitutaceae bacterium]